MVHFALVVALGGAMGLKRTWLAFWLQQKKMVLEPLIPSLSPWSHQHSPCFGMEMNGNDGNTWEHTVDLKV